MKYVCNKCMKKYASTDGVRKHSRKKHLEWISFLKPKQYCTEIKSLFDSDELQKLLEPIPPISEMKDSQIISILILGKNCYNTLEPNYYDISEDSIVDAIFEALSI